MMGQRIKKELTAFQLLLRSAPTLILSLFFLSVFSMNLLANKSVNLPVDWLALDCGIIVSWFTFLTMDIITKHFGPKAANELSVLAIVINLLLCLVFFAGSRIPGAWGESYVSGSEDVINTALDNTFGGAWYVLAGSTLAFLVSSFVNNLTNWGVGRVFQKHPDGFPAYAARTYVSTAVGQFADNLVFALVVSHTFFGWSMLQCFTCALTGMVVELLCEAVFSFLGFRICRRWKATGVGKAYLDYVNNHGAVKQ